MTAWVRPLSLYARRHNKLLLYIVVLFVVIITTIFTSVIAYAAPSTNRTISFSARLKSISGAVVSDGNYNVTFRLYNVSQGGTPIWSETYHDANGVTAGQDNRVRVLNGYLNVKLGSLNTFGSSVNWDDNLWLTMDIGGVAQEASIEEINWDGEMSPRIQLTAVPYAISAGSVGGKTADDLVQLGQGTQTDGSNNASIAINKTGSGDLLHLQSSGTDAFRLHSSGSITLGATGNQSIIVGESASGVGHNLSLAAGAGSSGGTLTLQGGDATDIDGNGGNVAIDTGTPTGSGNGGTIALGTDNASAIAIGNTNSTTSIAGSLQADNLDTSSAGELTIGGTNATGINLGNNTTITGNTTVKSQVDNMTALQVQNSADANVLSVSTGTGNILSLGSGTGGIGHVAHVSDGTYNATAGNQTTQSSTITRAVPAGHTLIGSLSTDGALALGTVTVTDSKGNTYSMDAATSSTGTAHLYIFSGHITTPLAAGDTITLQKSASATRWAWNVEEFDNIVAVSRLDQTSNHNDNTAAMSSGVTGATTDANELVFGGFAYTGPSTRTVTPGPGFNNSPPTYSTAGSSDRGNFVQWKYVSETGPQESTATISVAATWAAGVATYRTTGEMGIAGSLGMAAGNGYTGSINIDNLTGDRTYILPDESGTFCMQNSANCGFLQADPQSAQDADIWVTGGGTFGDGVSIQADATNALQVQNDNGDQLFNVDTTANRVTIGEIDASATLLVLDVKTTSGDPTGVAGAMYYNSHAGKFRCFEDGSWRDCITPLPVSVTTETETTTDSTTPVDVTNMTFELAANTKYYYKFVIMHASDETTTGSGFGITAPAGLVMSNWCINTNALTNTAGPGLGSYCGAGDATLATTGVDNPGNLFTSHMEGYIETGSTPGELKLRIRSETNGKEVTVGEKSFGILQIVQ